MDRINKGNDRLHGRPDRSLTPSAIANLAAAMARRRSQRRYRDRTPKRDWAELHPDLISCILHRLDQAELLIGGVAGVCRSWRRAAREEPELWRRIDLGGGLWCVPPYGPKVSLTAMVRAALRLATGQCEAFLSELLDDDLLLLIAGRSPMLKSLHLVTSSVSNEGFSKAIKMLPLLEELEISFCEGIVTPEVIELVAEACPLLKHFRLVTRWYSQNSIASMVARMHKLRSLHLVGLKLDSNGLAAILDNCHHLEYLNMRLCSRIVMDDNLRVKLAPITMDDHEYSSDYNNGYEYWLDRGYFEHPNHCPCINCWDPSWEYTDDSDDGYYYFIGGDDDIDDADLEEHEKILDIKRMRRYLS